MTERKELVNALVEVVAMHQYRPTGELACDCGWIAPQRARRGYHNVHLAEQLAQRVEQVSA
jgi:hypothetical protein